MPRISQLSSLTTADNADEIAIVDVSASTTKKITRGELLKAPLPANSVTESAIALTTQSITVGNSSSVAWEAFGNVFYRDIAGDNFATPFTKIISVTVYNQAVGTILQQTWLNVFAVKLSGISAIREFKPTSSGSTTSYRIEVIGFI